MRVSAPEEEERSGLCFKLKERRVASAPGGGGRSERGMGGRKLGESLTPWNVEKVDTSGIHKK